MFVTPKRDDDAEEEEEEEDRRRLDTTNKGEDGDEVDDAADEGRENVPGRTRIGGYFVPIDDVHQHY